MNARSGRAARVANVDDIDILSGMKIDGTEGPRVCVIGTSGSGKTTLARRLAERLGVPYVCGDEMLWLPDWVQRPRGEHDAILRAAAARPAWTFDGNLGSRACHAYVTARATTIVWLDYPRHVVMRRIVLRTIRRVVRKERLFSGNVEGFRQSFLSRNSIIVWAATSHAPLRRRYAALFGQLKETGTTLVRLRTPRQTERWLGALPRGGGEGGGGGAEIR